MLHFFLKKNDRSSACQLKVRCCLLLLVQIIARNFSLLRRFNFIVFTHFALCVHSTKDIDESSAKRLYDAMSYAMANMMLIQVPVLGTTKEFYRLSDKATRISRKLALILRNYHSKCKCLTAPLHVSNVWVGSAGNVKLRGARFTTKGFSIERVRDDYKNLSRVLKQLISISGGDINKLPPDYSQFLLLLTKDNLTTEDEFLIVNNAALLPLKNRYFFYSVLSSLTVCCCHHRLIWLPVFTALRSS